MSSKRLSLGLIEQAVSGQRCIVTSMAGSGKSIFMKYLVAELLVADEEKRLAQKPLDWLLEQYRNRPRNEPPKRRSQETAAYDRDPIVVALRKRLADYRCEVEGCQSEHFQTESGELFVEVHHLVLLADGGLDVLENTVAVCPTHHRLLHHGKDRLALKAQLLQKRQSESTS